MELAARSLPVEVATSGVIKVSKDKSPLPENKNYSIEDEFNPQNPPSILKPRLKIDQGASLLNQRKQQELHDELERLYAYYSLTRKLETDSPRVQKLQHIADKMCEGTQFLPRVVIMNKGEKANAFVCPDGTIFITQSLLNRLDTEDEVAAVLGHELGHLMFETHEYTSRAVSESEKLGIGFVHEKASDSKASQLLQKAHYNSFAFGSAIRKVQGSDRDIIHMSGLTRASLNVAEHFFIDSSTSHQEEKALDQIFHGEVIDANLEIIKAAARDKKFRPDQLKDIANKLHLEDLDEAYKIFWNKRIENYEFTKVLNELVVGRLTRAGYAPEDAALMLLVNNSRDSSIPQDCYLVNTQEKLDKVIARLQDFSDNPQASSAMFGLAFNKRWDLSSQQELPTLALLKLISVHLYNTERTPEGVGIPVTGKYLIDLLERIQEVRFNKQSEEQTRCDFNSFSVTKFLLRTYVESATGPLSSKDTEEIQEFLTLLKNSKISFDKEEIAKNFYLSHKVRNEKDKYGCRTAVYEAVHRILGVEVKEKTFDFKEIDEFFKVYTEKDGYGIGGDLARLILKMKDQFRDENARKRILAYLNMRIGHAKLKRERPVLNKSETGQLRDALMKFNLKTVLAMGLFESDTEEFYAFLEPAMSELVLVMAHERMDPNSLPKTQLINLCKNLFHDPDWYSGSLFVYGPSQEAEVTTNTFGERIYKTHINNYEKFFKLPLIQMISNKEDAFSASNIKDLLASTELYLASIQLAGLSDSNNGFDLMSDGALNLILGPAIMRNFSAILDQGIQDTEFADLYTFVNRFYARGVEKDQLLRSINKRYLRSSQVSFEDKLDYLYKYGEKVGYEGIAIVVDQIEDLAAYRIFRKRFSDKIEDYLKGKSSAEKVVLADNLGAQIVSRFRDLLRTCENDPSSMGYLSTGYARQWVDIAFGQITDAKIRYDTVTEKFILSAEGREVFRSVADTFVKLRSLSPAQRFAIAHKALFDTDGAFSSLENRQFLANNLLSALGIKQEFVRDILYTGALEADAEYIGFPAANMIGSLLFRALDINSIKLDEIKNERFIYRSKPGVFAEHKQVSDILTDEQILHDLRSTTREIILFGGAARKDSGLRIAQIAEESDQLYYLITAKLNRLIGKEIGDIEQSSARDYEIDPAMEAVIRGVESTGALGIRALQLATQFHNFSENMNKRLSETFDSNPGMNRLSFWENLHLRAQENPQVEAFLTRIKLGRYLGGGSLQTTYAATYAADNGEIKEVIIKRKNPSVEGLLKRSYTTCRNVLDIVSQKKGTKESANYAKTGLMLIDLAQKWCIDDLNDAFYEERDDLFRQTVEKFNREQGEQFYVPERVFTETKVKSEELAPGRTVNQVLKDGSVPESTKKEIVQALGKFFLYQLRGNSFIDEEGNRFFLVHSDPHIGNYMADTSSDGKPGIGVIDRSLYLKLDEKDVKVLEKLIGNSNPTDFVYSFINLVLDRNKDRGLTRQVVTARVFVEIAKEYRRQVVHGKMDKFALLRTLLGELSKQGREAPLELRLMIRNIAALQGLMKKYGLSLQ